MLAERARQVLLLLGVMASLVHSSAHADVHDANHHPKHGAAADAGSDAAANHGARGGSPTRDRLRNSVPMIVYQHIGALADLVNVPRRYIALALSIMRGNATAVSATLLQELKNRSIQLVASRLPFNDARVRMAALLAKAALAPTRASVRELVRGLKLGRHFVNDDDDDADGGAAYSDAEKRGQTGDVPR